MTVLELYMESLNIYLLFAWLLSLSMILRFTYVCLLLTAYSFLLFCPGGFACSAGFCTPSVHQVEVWQRELRVGGRLVSNSWTPGCLCAGAQDSGEGAFIQDKQRRMCAGCRWGLACWTWEASVFKTIRKQTKSSKETWVPYMSGTV